MHAISTILNVGAFYLEEAEEELLQLERAQWCRHPLAICLSPSVLAITMADGVWKIINDSFDTLIDLYEEQDLPNAMLAAMAREIEELAEGYGGVLQVERVVALAGDTPVTARAGGDEIARELSHVAAFLRDAAATGQSVVASF